MVLGLVMPVRDLRSLWKSPFVLVSSIFWYTSNCGNSQPLHRPRKKGTPRGAQACKATTRTILHRGGVAICRRGISNHTSIGVSPPNLRKVRISHQLQQIIKNHSQKWKLPLHLLLGDFL